MKYSPLLSLLLLSCNPLKPGGSTRTDAFKGYLEPVTRCSLESFKAQGSGFTANWTFASSVHDYLFACESETGAQVLCIGVITTCGTDDLVPGTQYRCSLQGKNPLGGVQCGDTRTFTPIGPFQENASTAWNSSQILLRWTNAVGAAGYKIEELDPSGNVTRILAEPTSSPFLVTGLTAETTYHFRVTALNDNNLRVMDSTISVTTLASDHTLSLGTPSISAPGSLIVPFTKGSSIQSIALKYGTTPGVYPLVSSCASSPCTLSGLTPGQSYYLVLQGTDASNESHLSPEVTATPLGSTAILTQLQSNGTDLNLTWSGVPGASLYRVRYGSTSQNLAANAEFSTTSGTLSGLNPGSQLYFRLEALNTWGFVSSTESSLDLIAPFTLSPPTLTQANSLLLSWSNAQSATAYTVHYGTNANELSLTASSCTTSPCQVTGLTGGTTYFFQVEATHNQGGLQKSAILSGTPLSLPVLTLSQGDSTLSTSWTSAGAGATYTLRYGNNSGSHPNLVSGNATSPYLISGLTPGVHYFVVVEASNAHGSLTSQEQSMMAEGSSTLSLQAPTLTAANALIFTWGQGSGIQTVSLKQGTTSGTFTTTTSCTLSPCTLTGLTPGLTYYFQLQAQDYLGASVLSNSVSGMAIAGGPSLGTITQTSPTEVTFSWGSVSGANLYRVEYGTTSGGYNTLLTATSATTATVQGLTPGSPYFFRVRAENAHGWLPSNEQSITTVGVPVLNAPTITAASTLQLAYTLPTGATAVSISYGTTSGTYPNTASCTSSPCHLALTAGNTYYFRATATNGNQGQQISNEVLGTPLGMVSLNNPQQSGLGTASLSWSAVNGATSYRIEHGSTSGNWNTQNTPTSGTTDSISGITANTARYIRLAATNNTGTLFSLEKVFRPLGAFTLNPFALTQSSQLIYTWSNSEGATTYVVNRGTSTGAYPFTTSCTTSPCTETGLTAGQTYYGRVTASNSEGGFLTSNEASGTPLSNPTLTLTGASLTSVSASWTPVLSGVTYELRYGTSSGNYPTLVSANATSPESVSGLSPAVPYYFRLTSSNASGSLVTPEGTITTPAFIFSPTSASIGSILTLTCADCSLLSTVTVGAQPAIILSKDSTTATAFIMPGSSSGNVSGTLNGISYTQPGFTLLSSTLPLNQQGSKLIGSDAVGANPYQGTSAAISADGMTAIMGGYRDDNYKGAAWVFRRSGNTWTQEGSKLVGSDEVGHSEQGTSAAISADGNTAIIGGRRDNFYRGAAWVFTRSGNTWTQQGSKLVGSDFVANSVQGTSTAISADGNTVMIGGSGDTSGLGAAWIFTRSGTTWTQQGSKLVSSDSVGNAIQGYSTALSADGSTAIMGGYGDNSGVGAAWVFTRSGTTWTQQGNKLVGSNPAGYAYQGYSVALSADGNTALIGGNGDDYGTGAVWVFTRSGTTWTQQGKLVGSNAAGYPAQGFSVALSADGNTALIGGASDSSGIGAVWVFTRSGNTWTQQGTKLVGSGYTGQPYQGSSLALSSDGMSAIIGGKRDDSDVGAAWIFGF